MKSHNPPRRAAFSRDGYTLLEFLIAISLGSAVLASLGGILLVSEMRVSANIQRNLNTKDAVNRAIDLIRREGTLSSRISNIYTRDATPSLVDCAKSTPLIYHQAGNSVICYKSVSPLAIKGSSAFPSEYKINYKGPCVLVRIGPPYKPDGSLYSSNAPVAQVLLDGLAESTTGCSPAGNGGFSVDMRSQNKNNAIFDRSAKVTINLAYNLSYIFNVTIPSSRTYDGNDYFADCTMTAGTGCENSINAQKMSISHYKPENSGSASRIEGNSSKENIFYFLYPYKAYTFKKFAGSSLPCSYDNCYIQRSGSSYSVQLKNVDMLVFPDKEIRPPS